MSFSADEIRIRMRQQLEGDELLGVQEIPLSRAVVASITSPQQAGHAEHVGGDPSTRLKVLDESAVQGCTRCALSETRTRTVFGQGSASARLVFVGEAPGYEEDRQGLAFVGRAGQLLTKMIEAMGLSRDEVFICNVLKCRPPNNRTPAQDEIAACSPHLFEQLRIIRPEILCALGAPAAQTLLNTREGIGRLRGRFHDFRMPDRPDESPIPLMPTYHPAYLLRSPGEKHKAWEDLKLIMQRLGLG